MIFAHLFSLAGLAAFGFALAGCESFSNSNTAAAQVVETVVDETGLSLDGGYGYPKPAGSEVVSTIVNDDVPKPAFEVRVQAVTNITQNLAQRPYPPLALQWTEGDEHDIFVMMDTGSLNVNTVYKARALVKAMSSAIRNNQLFQQYGVESYASIFDLLKLAGFEQLVVTNGDDFSYAFIID